MLLDQRQHLALDELRIGARHRVVFAAALAPWASWPPLPMSMATIGGTRRCAIRLSSVAGEILPGRRAAVADHDERRLACRATYCAGT